MTTCVVALGKIGLPLAVQIASKGEHVIGVDINPSVVDLVNEGQEPFPGEAQLADKLSDVVNTGMLEATTNTFIHTCRWKQNNCVFIVFLQRSATDTGSEISSHGF